MKTLNKDFLSDLKELPPKDKLKLAEFLLEELDSPNPIIEKEWAIESERRLKLYKAGKIKSFSLDEVFGKRKKLDLLNQQRLSSMKQLTTLIF